MSFEYKILKFEDLNQPKSHDLDIYENVKKADPDEELTKKLNVPSETQHGADYELLFKISNPMLILFCTQ